VTIRSLVTSGSPPRKLTQLCAWVSSTHPVPSLVVAGLTTLFAWSVGLPFGQVVLVFFAMLANQTSIGLSNDWWDQPADAAAGRGDKPLANGVLSVRAARNTSFVLLAVALGLSAVLGTWALACQALMLAAGWWYNLHAKRH
jgi:4-hydroxybenzoate polyprenyltransferase